MCDDTASSLFSRRKKRVAVPRPWQCAGCAAEYRFLHVVDTQNLLREEISLASFTAGFKLAWGLSKELEADGLYSFDEEETERVCRRMEQEE